MADDLTKTGAADRRRVNVHQVIELRYWTGALDCDAAALRAAVAEVGTVASVVRAYLLQQADERASAS